MSNRTIPMKTMIIAAALALSTFATAVSAHTVQQKPIAKPDWAKQAFDSTNNR